MIQPIMVKENCYYRTRGGIDVGPMVKSGVFDVLYAWRARLNEYIVSWPDNGRYLQLIGEHEWDLIEEIQEPLIIDDVRDYAISG